MTRKDGRTTSPLLLKRVADWADHCAWDEFFNTYDPLIRSWCGGSCLDDLQVDDLCQQVWIELADRMRIYQYDPGRTFRGWLRQFCRSRRVDLLRKRGTELARFVNDQPADQLMPTVDLFNLTEDEDFESRRSLLLSRAEEVQRAVKDRVESQTWQVFWRIAVEGCSFRETARDLGMTYAAVFAAHKRVARMLRAEGKRSVSQRPPECPEAITPDPS